MATFVLVHGAWQGGWCWKRVSALLRQYGHEVYCPTLTGLGERAHLLCESIDLDTHIQDILGVVACEELTDIVLCGHSYGGVVITGVADKLHQYIRSLVYLDALVPENGQNVIDLLPADIGMELQKAARTKGDGYRVAPTPAIAFGVGMQDQGWVDRHCVDHPLGSFVQAIELQGLWKQVARYRYIYATGWTPGIGGPFFKKAQREVGWEAMTIPCGHDVMIDMPKELAQILVASI
ncbi:alpha/beta fold hydrolase [Microbulbifer sp. JMSA004]|uniref:alpha/beta fold hydrolase n=1 Tax=unclassified Microbulbifer TaxID=2619833 RepID=UPI0024AE3127|nr:alpha/beta hydrolase [Microbulbifer sp. VAAF005]WHI46458.1 alpha/beta hydrolase [Microbulbifer sp. VAAF005]